MQSSVLETLRARAPHLWARICPHNTTRPDVPSMIALLTDMGVQLHARPSGVICLRVLHDNLDFIEDHLARGVLPLPPDPGSHDEDDSAQQEPNSAHERAAPPPVSSFEHDTSSDESADSSSRDIPADTQPSVVDTFDDNVQCENSLLAEAHERMVSCVITSYRTDAGLLLLENELIMFQDQTSEGVTNWVQTMRNAWSCRLHSKVLDDFCEALDLWVLSQNVMMEDAQPVEHTL